MKTPLQLPHWPSDVCPPWVIHRSLYYRGLAKLDPVSDGKVWKKKQKKEQTSTEAHLCTAWPSFVPAMRKGEVRRLRTTVRATTTGSTPKDRAYCVTEPGNQDFYGRNQWHLARQTNHTTIGVDCREQLGKKTVVAVRIVKANTRHIYSGCEKKRGHQNSTWR